MGTAKPNVWLAPAARLAEVCLPAAQSSPVGHVCVTPVLDSAEIYTATGALSGDSPWGDIQRVTYELKTSTSGASRSWILSQRHAESFDEATPDVEDQLMIRGVDSMRFPPTTGAMERFLGHDGHDLGEYQFAGCRSRDIQLDGGSGKNEQPIEILVPIDSQSRTNSTTRREPEMKFRKSKLNMALAAQNERASVLIIVLWIVIGLVGITLYFANSMTLEYRASDNRVNGLTPDQAIEGAARYVGYALRTYATNGTMPTNALFICDAVPIGDAHVWIIGRDTREPCTEPVFDLVDEASKLNLNLANTNTLTYLPNMTSDVAGAIVDWRNTNGSGGYRSIMAR